MQLGFKLHLGMRPTVGQGRCFSCRHIGDLKTYGIKGSALKLKIGEDLCNAGRLAYQYNTPCPLWKTYLKSKKL